MHLLHSPQEASRWLRSHVRATLRTDSRLLQAGDGFIAWPGAASDGRAYVAAALAAGAQACLVEAKGVEQFGLSDERVACYTDLKAATGLIAAHYYAQPSEHLDVVAVTGTNGKTSTAWWLAQALNTLGYRGKASNTLLSNKELLAQYSCGLIGTLGTGKPGAMVFNGLTTPDPVRLQAELARLHALGASACAVEASSIGLAEERLAGTVIHTAIFTNFTQDHLDYHRDMASYWLAKRALFDWSGLQSAVINLDDDKGAELASYCAAKGLKVLTISQLRTDATLCAQSVEHTDNGMVIAVREAGMQAQIDSAMVGDYNVSNLLGVVAAMRSLGIDLAAACRAVSQCTAVPGRMECITALDAPLVAVDYAHTPDALDKVLSALRPITQSRGGQLWCVFGCGGDRDASKRPLMAAAAERVARHVVVTSDNPRSESPDNIIAQVVAGLHDAANAYVQPDRARAITYAITHAQPRDVIVLAGKGHEDYQDIAGTKYPFSDLTHARAALKLRASDGEEQP
jgi:UDP-N-acetylmuramyl-tripeptide synthetase